MGAGQKYANIQTQATICDCHRRSVLTEERAAPYRLHSDKFSESNQTPDVNRIHNPHRLLKRLRNVFSCHRVPIRRCGTAADR